MSYVRLQVDASVAAEYTYLWYPSNQRAVTKNPVILCHGAGVADQFSGTSWPHAVQLAWALARAGIPVGAGYFGGDVWGNATHVSRIGAMRTKMLAAFGLSATKVNLVACSMGNGGAVNYAVANPTLVGALAGVIPLSNLPYNYNNNLPAGARAGIATAWGTTNRTVADGVLNSTTTVTSATAAFVAGDVAGSISGTGIPVGATIVSVTNATTVVISAAATATASGVSITVFKPLSLVGSPNADLVTSGAALSGVVPSRFYYSTVDPYIRVADVQALATATGGSAIQVDTTSGHADGSFTSLAAYNGGNNYSDLITWLQANGS